MKRRWHRLRSNKKVEMPSLLFFVDTETGEEKREDGGGDHTLKLGYAVRWNRKNDKEGNRLKWIRFEKAEEFWNWIEENIYEKGKAYVFAHKWRFDYDVLDGDKYLLPLEWSLKNPIRDNDKWLDHWRKGKRSMVILDTLNFFKTGVREIGESIGLPKIEVDFKTCTQEELEDHCVRDVEIIYEAIKRTLKWLEEEKLGSFKPTIASLAFSIYRHKFMNEEIVVHNHKEATQLEINSYKGGRTECFFIGDTKNNEVYNVDVQSMHPSVMLSNYFPCKFKGYSNRLKIPDLIRLLEQYLVIARVDIEVDKGCIAEKENKLIFPVGRFETTLTSPELRYVMENGVIYRVKEASWYEGKKIFKKYIEAMWGKRLEAKREGNTANDWFYKLIMNSLYGKFGQRTRRSKEIDCGEPPKNCFFFQYDSERDNQTYNCYKFGDKIWTTLRKEPSMDTFVAIASFVSAYGRMRVLELIKKAGERNVYYVDTDGLYIKKEGLDRLGEEIKEGEIGKLNVKWNGRLKVYGVKDYEEDGERKIKGIKKDAWEKEENVYIQEHVEGYREAKKKNIEGKVRTVLVRKELKREYDKGYVGKDGWIKPLIRAEF